MKTKFTLHHLQHLNEVRQSTKFSSVAYPVIWGCGVSCGRWYISSGKRLHLLREICSDLQSSNIKGYLPLTTKRRMITWVLAISLGTTADPPDLRPELGPKLGRELGRELGTKLEAELHPHPHPPTPTHTLTHITPTLTHAFSFLSLCDSSRPSSGPSSRPELMS